ncbi:MAG: hypothetical protein MRJ65_14935 [Candidatus Brocadiaceae bacterium]|nr:hypothetical protein [Candidatus Brocadiaceae bacterium]
MFSCRVFCCFVLTCSFVFAVSLSAFSQNYIINGVLQNEGREDEIKNSVVRRESLIIKEKRVYIHVVLDEGSKHITDYKRYQNLLYLLPKEVVYDDISKHIFYSTETVETEVGRKKSFLGFMPYISLAEGVKIISSPTDAKLLISSHNNTQGIHESVIHSEESMEITLGKKCGQCHLLEYIFSHEHWAEEDVLHAFNRMQMEEEERFTRDEQQIIDVFKKYQKGEIDKGKVAEFKSLKKIGEQDVLNMAEKVYTNNCVPCHNPSRMTDVTLLYSKKRCKSIVDRMKEKEPSLFLSTDMDKLAGYLWEIKLRSYKD